MPLQFQLGIESYCMKYSGEIGFSEVFQKILTFEPAKKDVHVKIRTVSDDKLTR